MSADLLAQADSFYMRGQVEQALQAYGRVLALTPDQPEALLRRGAIYSLDKSDYAAAAADLARAAALTPDLPMVHWLLLRARLHLCDWRDHAALVSRLNQEVADGKTAVDPVFFHSISQAPAQSHICARAFGRGYPARPSLWRPRPEGRIRLGYLSGDLRDHATANLIAGVIESHDRARFEVIALDNTLPDAGPMRRRLVSAFDRFLSVRDLSDAAAAQEIARIGIDILVHLNGYAGEQRTGIVAHRPAPLQVNWLGFPGTLGLDYVDYLIGDAVVIPLGEEAHYSEQVVRLAHSYQPNDARRAIAPVPARAACNLPDGAFVFCNFNSAHKFTPQFFALWMRLLAQVENSVLWLLDWGQGYRDNLRQAAAAAGIAPERLVFAPQLPQDRHLARLALADLALDNLPYNQHTTGSDVLWAGVPLLTCRGTTFAGRVAASLLTAVGLPELIAEDLQQYEDMALRLAQAPQERDALRRRLAQNRLTAPLFDTAGFTRQIETAYRTMWEIHRRGEAPHGFAVS